MASRGAYPGRGGRGNRRSLRRPASGAVLAILLAGLAACGGSAAGEAVPEAKVDPRAADEAPVWSRPTGVPRPPAAEWRGDFVVEPPPPGSLTLDGAASGLDELLDTVARALSASDISCLVALMVGEREFREIVYPALPVAHPPINASFGTVWMLQLSDSWPGLKRLIEDYGGRDLEILDVRFARPDQDFGHFRLHETSEVDLRVDGERRTDRLFGSVVQVGGQWKVLSYPDDR